MIMVFYAYALFNQHNMNKTEQYQHGASVFTSGIVIKLYTIFVKMFNRNGINLKRRIEII